MKSLDTSSDAEKVQMEISRRMDPEKRLQYAALLSETCRTLLGEGIKNAIQTTMKSK
jgi:hypothetical protein